MLVRFGDYDVDVTIPASSIANLGALKEKYFSLPKIVLEESSQDAAPKLGKTAQFWMKEQDGDLFAILAASLLVPPYQFGNLSIDPSLPKLDPSKPMDAASALKVIGETTFPAKIVNALSQLWLTETGRSLIRDVVDPRNPGRVQILNTMATLLQETRPPRSISIPKLLAAEVPDRYPIRIFVSFLHTDWGLWTYDSAALKAMGITKLPKPPDPILSSNNYAIFSTFLNDFTIAAKAVSLGPCPFFLILGHELLHARILVSPDRLRRFASLVRLYQGIFDKAQSITQEHLVRYYGEDLDAKGLYLALSEMVVTEGDWAITEARIPPDLLQEMTSHTESRISSEYLNADMLPLHKPIGHVGNFELALTWRKTLSNYTQDSFQKSDVIDDVVKYALENFTVAGAPTGGYADPNKMLLV